MRPNGILHGLSSGDGESGIVHPRGPGIRTVELEFEFLELAGNGGRSVW